jgi:hypothetical protein
LVGGGGLLAGDGKFNLDAVVVAFKSDVASVSGLVKGERIFAGGQDGGLELENYVVGQTGGIGEVAGSSASGSSQAGVWIEKQANMERMGHGQVLEARATSQASRHSGQ